MSTYHPVVLFDLPSGNEHAVNVKEEAGLDLGENRTKKYGYRRDPSDELLELVEAAIEWATHGAVDTEREFDLEQLTHEPARLEIYVHYPGREDGD